MHSRLMASLRAHSTCATPRKTPVVGVIGLGNMGIGMASALAGAGFSLIVTTRSIDKAWRFQKEVASQPDDFRTQSVHVATTAAEVAQRADIITTCLANEEAGRSVFCGEGGIVEGLTQDLTKDRIVVDHSTVSLEVSTELRKAVERVGCGFVDAPISGTPERAQAGDLTVMAGGDAATVAQCMPVFHAIGSDVEVMGGPGSGAAMKLVNQLLASVHTAVACEALAVARALGLHDVEQIGRVVSTSSGQSRAFDRAVSVMRAVEPQLGGASTLDTYLAGPSGAPLRILLKDITCAQRSTKNAWKVQGKAPAVLPVTSAATTMYEETLAISHADIDTLAMLRRFDPHRSEE